MTSQTTSVHAPGAAQGGQGGSAAPPPITLIAPRLLKNGGQESATRALAVRLLRAGHRVTVVSLDCDMPAHPRLRWRRIRGPRRPASIAYPWFVMAATWAIRGRERGVVHAAGAVVLTRCDAITVHFCHHAARARGGSRASRPGAHYALNGWIDAGLSRLGESWSYRPSRVRRLVAASEGVADELRAAFPRAAGCVTVIPNGVDTDVFRAHPESRSRVREGLGLSTDDLVAVFVGGDWERKGLTHAIAGVARARPWHLLVVGPGDAERYGAEAAGLGVAARVHFLGPQRDTAPYYAAADAFVFPTAYEAFPLVALEAAAAELPLLASRVNGVDEILQEGETGWFVERDGADIATRLQELAADRSLGRRLGRAARESVRPLSWDAVADAYGNLYARLTAAGSSR